MTMFLEQNQETQTASSKLLCIAMPTYNRAARLDKALEDLFTLIIKSGEKNSLSVLVSNNGSTDSTSEIIEKHSNIFGENNILFFSTALPGNRGFDTNVLNCYEHADADYIWFVSDDDNLADDAIAIIIDDIRTSSPSLLYYNFNQEPYGLSNPYITEKTFYGHVDAHNIKAISKIIHFPKLTSLVIRKIDEKAGDKISEARGLGFIHAALAMQIALNFGRVLHSNKYTARPDNDFMDHIDFPPYIGNNVEKMLKLVLQHNDRMDLASCFTFGIANPLTSSMNTLATYYRGNIVLSPELKAELYSTVIHEIKKQKLTQLMTKDFAMHVIRLLFGYVYNIGSMVFTGRKAAKLRINGKVV